MRVPTPDTGENNAAYWRKRAEDAEAEVAELRSWIDGVPDLVDRAFDRAYGRVTGSEARQ